MTQDKRQSGQTLIETITALFILTTALVAGLSLAIYAASSSNRSKEEVVASNLAREGIEVVRMMRDSNWLMAEDYPGVFDLFEDNGGCQYGNGNSNRKPCYPEAFYAPTRILSTASDNDYRVTKKTINSTYPTGWSLETVNGKENYLLCLQPDGSYRHNDQGGAGITCNATSNARFARRVEVTTLPQNLPYTSAPSGNSPPGPTGNNGNGFGGHSPQKVVTVYVVWEGKRCTPFGALNNFDPKVFSATTPCKIVMEERLTNWKDYR
jgi:Tfp pilus assembly protein PilV